MHDKRFKAKKEVLAIDVDKTCDELAKYIPTGKITRRELNNKMSLYLLGQLFYGIVLVYKHQVLHLCEDATSVLESLKQIYRIEIEPKSVRRRKHAEITDEDEEDDIPEGTPSKKRASAAPKHPPLLDLASPSAYVEPPRTRALIETEFPDDLDALEPRQIPPLEELLNQGRYTPPPAPGETPIRYSRPNEIDVADKLRSPKISYAVMNLLDSPPLKSLPPETPNSFRPFDMEVSGIDGALHQGGDISLGLNGREPIYRTQLEDLPEVVLPPIETEHLVASKHATRSKRKRLIFDEQKEITTEEMRKNMRHFSDIMKSSQQIEKEREDAIQADLTVKMLHPRPFHLKGLHPRLLALFDSALKQVRGLPLTVDEVQKMTDEDMRKFHIPDDVHTWHSESTNERNQSLLNECDVTPEFGKQEGQQAIGVVRSSKVSFVEIPQEHPSSIERGRRATEGSSAVRSTGLFDQMATPLAKDDIPMRFEIDEEREDEERHEPPYIMPIKNGSQKMISPVDSAEAEAFLREMQPHLVGGKAVKFGKFVNPGNATRRQAARKFFSLLQLLKTNEIRVQQKDAYSEILIKLDPSGGQEAYHRAGCEYEAPIAAFEAVQIDK